MKNPAGFAYSDETGVDSYGGFTSMLITGRGNRNDPAFENARKAGAEIIAYFNATDIPLRYSDKTGLEEEYYAGFESWPYPSRGARCNYYDPQLKDYTRMADIRAGSKTLLHVIRVITDEMRSRRINGCLLDVCGERPWTKQSAWDTWPQWEKIEWASGNIWLVQRLRELADIYNPGFIIMNNNSWGDGWARRGEDFVNGRCLEHHDPNPYQLAMAQRPYGVPSKRRVLAICKGKVNADLWLATPDSPEGVTHVAVDNGTYNKVSLPIPTPFVNINPPPP